MKRISIDEHASRVPHYKAWIQFLDLCEEILKDQGFQKLLTPYLVTSGALESNLEPFSFDLQFGNISKKVQLPTSPEFHIKKALATGYFEDVFEIKTCFRNLESSACHSSEFKMLEFYKKDCGMEEFIKFVLQLLNQIHSKLAGGLPGYSRPVCKFDGSNVKLPFTVVKIEDLFFELGIDLHPESTSSALKIAARKLGIHHLEEDSFDDLFFRIWLGKIEPSFDPARLTVVHSYPPSQAALSKVGSDGWAKRFEIYGSGLELANAFEELSDSQTILYRWRQENAKRISEGKNPHPVDHQFISCLDHLPKCSGIAIGLERLFMMFYGFKNINDFNFFR